MPTGPRIRANNIFGLVSDNPLSSAAVILNSSGLTNLPVVSSAHAIITLDPLRVNGAPEIIIVTAHGSLATVSTITRGAYGTTSRAHPQGTLWTHTPTNEDFIPILTSTTRPTDPYRGELIFETDTNSFVVRDTSDTWKTLASPDSGWLAPTLLNGWVVYDATYGNAAMYRKVGGIVYLRGLIKSGTVTAGTPIFVLPVGFRPGIWLVIASSSNNAYTNVEVKPDGNVLVGGPTPSATWLSLDNVSFPAT